LPICHQNFDTIPQNNYSRPTERNEIALDEDGGRQNSQAGDSVRRGDGSNAARRRPFGAEQIAKRLASFGIVPGPNESLAETTARALGISCRELRGGVAPARGRHRRPTIATEYHCITPLGESCRHLRVRLSQARAAGFLAGTRSVNVARPGVLYPCTSHRRRLCGRMAADGKLHRFGLERVPAPPSREGSVDTFLFFDLILGYV
jgi:hypothetical protein